MENKLIEVDIITSIFNDGRLASQFHGEIMYALNKSSSKFKQSLLRIKFVFVNDGSTDDSILHLIKLHASTENVEIIDLSRNFGQHIALACALNNSVADWVVRANVDLQDNATELCKLLNIAIENNKNLVIGKYSSRKSTRRERFSAYFYFLLFNILTGFNIEQWSSPLRVMSKKYVESYNLLKETTRFPQGIDAWLGFSPLYVPIKHTHRSIGKSSYNLLKRFRLGIAGMLYFSNRPLKAISILGILLAFVGFIVLAFVLFDKLFLSNQLPGYASLMGSLLLGFGIQFFILGIVSLYISEIFTETKMRPLYLVKDHFCPHTINQKQ